MVQITNALYALAKKKGVHFKFEHKVSEICVKNKKATGVVANGTRYSADVVISNMDVTPTYKKLLPQQKASKKAQKNAAFQFGGNLLLGDEQIFPTTGAAQYFIFKGL